MPDTLSHNESLPSLPAPHETYSDEFTQLLQVDALASLKRFLRKRWPVRTKEWMNRETIMAQLQARGRTAYGLDDGPSHVTLNVAMMSNGPVDQPERISDCSTPTQVVDVQCVSSDSQSEEGGSGI